jgi:L-fucose isomerase
MLAQTGYLCHRIVGDVVEKEGIPVEFARNLTGDLTDWLAAATTFADMWGTPYASFGGASMNMETGLTHVIPARRYLGLNVIHIDMLEIRARIDTGRYDSEAKALLNWLRKMMPDGIRMQSPHGDKVENLEKLEYQCKMYLAMKEIMAELGATVGGFQGQRQWTDYLPTGDVPEALLNDLFDHTGRKTPIAFATENDFNRGVAQRVAVGLSRGLPGIFMDFRKVYFPGDPLVQKHATKEDMQAFREGGGLVDFCNSGNHPPFYAALDQKSAAKNYAKVRLWPVIASYFPGGGFSNEFDAAPCKMVFSSLLLRPDGQFVLQAALGQSVALSEALRNAINHASDPTWPHLHGTFVDDVKEVVDTWGCNHAVGMVTDDHESSRRRYQYWADIARVPLVAYRSMLSGGRTVPLPYQMYGGQTEGARAYGPRG